jgi:hypothetical protein
LFVGGVWKCGSVLEFEGCCLLVVCVNVDRYWSVKGVVCLVVNGKNKHVEDILVDAVSGCKFCSVSF